MSNKTPNATAVTTSDSSVSRVIDPTTGGQKDSKIARFDLIPPGPLMQVASVYGYGCNKYAPRNWEKGYAWGLSFAAKMRHAWAFWNGETVDPESGLCHLAHDAWHSLTLMEWLHTHPELDDRPRRRLIAATGLPEAVIKLSHQYEKEKERLSHDPR